MLNDEAVQVQLNTQYSPIDKDLRFFLKSYVLPCVLGVSVVNFYHGGTECTEMHGVI